MSHLKTTAMEYAFFEGKMVPTGEAKVSVMTNALQYGTGFFGGIRGYWSETKKELNIFRLDDHIARFVQSASIIGVELAYDEAALKKIMLDLVAKNKPTEDVYFRPFAYASSLNLSPNLERDNTFEFALYMMPLGDYLPTDRGIKVCVSSWTRTPDNSIPSRAKISGGYINSALAKKEAMQNGYDEAIFLTANGHVSEGSAMNIFMVRRGVLITPPVSDDILEGITRRSIMEMAKQSGIEVEERSIDRTELYAADELFFTGTGAQISWIESVDRRTIGTGKRGPISAMLQDLFFQVVRGSENKYRNWLTTMK